MVSKRMFSQIHIGLARSDAHRPILQRDLLARTQQELVFLDPSLSSPDSAEEGDSEREKRRDGG